MPCRWPTETTRRFSASRPAPTPASTTPHRVGKGTQDISANGVDPGSNNFQMDGVAVNNIANSGSANDGTIYTGIPIPSPDAIAEFKVQTSTYDASYGRNPGANVNVSTKIGHQRFSRSAFEFFRNSQLNASDFFYNLTPGPATPGPQSEPVRRHDRRARSRKTSCSSSSAIGERVAKTAWQPRAQTLARCCPHRLNPYAAIGSRGTCGTPPSIPEPVRFRAECDATAQAFAAALGIPTGTSWD